MSESVVKTARIIIVDDTAQFCPQAKSLLSDGFSNFWGTAVTVEINPRPFSVLFATCHNSSRSGFQTLSPSDRLSCWRARGKSLDAEGRGLRE